MNTTTSVVDLHFIRTTRVYVINLQPIWFLQPILEHHDHHHHYPISQSMEKERMTTRCFHIRDEEAGSVDYDLPIVFNLQVSKVFPKLFLVTVL